MKRRAPGRVLLAIARRGLPRVDVAELVQPAVADLQHEWRESAGAGFVARSLVRARAYAGIMRIAGHCAFAGAWRAARQPLPWPIAKELVGRSAGFVVVTVTGKSLATRFLGERDWLFAAPDALFVGVAFVPFFWPYCFPNRTRPRQHVPEVTAGQIAKLTTVFTLIAFIGLGWAAPALRQQYLAHIGLDAWQLASPRQWLLPELLAGWWMSSSDPLIVPELHRRLLFVAITPIAAIFAWSAVVRGGGHDGRGTGFQALAFTVVVAVGFVATLLAGPSHSEASLAWLGLLTAFVGSLVVVSIAHEARRREQSEEKTT